MKKLIFVALTFAATSVFAAGEYDSKNSCIMTYEKSQTTKENLLMVCDGELILNVKVAPFSSQYTQDLETTFKSWVNSNGQKKCIKNEDQALWFVLCSK